MYIIAIAWLYVAVMMAGAEPNMTASVLTFVFYGVIPCALLLWLMGTKHRKFISARKVKNTVSIEEVTQSQDSNETQHSNHR